MSCPNFLAASRRDSNKSTMIIVAGEKNCTVKRAARPIGPLQRPETLYRWFYMRDGEDPNFIERLGEYREHDQGFVIHSFRCMIKTTISMWSVDILCLGSVDQIVKSNHHLHSEKANYVYSSNRYYKL